MPSPYPQTSDKVKGEVEGVKGFFCPEYVKVIMISESLKVDIFLGLKEISAVYCSD